MTVAELAGRMSWAEFVWWYAELTREAEEAEEAARQARADALAARHATMG